MIVHIFYRHYNVSGQDGKHRPEWFTYEKSFTNLLQTIQDEKVNLHVVYDGDVKDNFINKYRDRFTLHQIDAGSDKESFFSTVRYANSINIADTDLIYFLENDYMHVPGWVEKVKHLFQTYSNLNYVSLYDHQDKYILPMYGDLVSKVFISHTHHWRTTPSTCGSFIITGKLLREDCDILGTMEGDHNKFLYLNKARGRFVCTPIPGLSTHCMRGLESPTINWEAISYENSY